MWKACLPSAAGTLENPSASPPGPANMSTTEYVGKNRTLSNLQENVDEYQVQAKMTDFDPWST